MYLKHRHGTSQYNDSSMFIRDMMNRVKSFIAESCSYEFVTQCKLYPSDPYIYISKAQILSAIVKLPHLIRAIIPVVDLWKTYERVVRV